MKKISFIVTFIFVLMAAALGWFLPLAAFSVDDNLTEGKQRQLDIERVNLTYRNDLSIAQKISIVNYEYQYEDDIEIDKGIYIQEEDVKQIVSDFLADFSGYRFDVDKGGFYATPHLVSLSNNRGTIVIWAVDFLISDEWEYICFIDDRTGAILRSTFYGFPEDWGNLIHGFYDMDDYHNGICERYLNAIYKHYSEKLNAKFITYHIVQQWDDADQNGYRLIFRDEKDDTFEITLNISIGGGSIETF